MRILIGILGTLLLLLQIKLWHGNGSILQVHALNKEVKEQEEKVEKLKHRNQVLDAEVKDLKNQLSALEERARTDLGMIKEGESFYQYSKDSAAK